MMVNDDGVVILTSLSLRCCRLDRFFWHCMALLAVTCSDFSCDMLCHTMPKFAEVSQSGFTSHSFFSYSTVAYSNEAKVGPPNSCFDLSAKTCKICRKYYSILFESGWLALFGLKMTRTKVLVGQHLVRTQDDQRWSCWQARCMR